MLFNPIKQNQSTVKMWGVWNMVSAMLFRYTRAIEKAKGGIATPVPVKIIVYHENFMIAYRSYR